MDFLQVQGNDLGVNLRGRDARMAEHFLDMPDACAASQHLGGAGVTQAVRGDGFGESRRLAISADDPPKQSGVHGGAVAR